jgi:hypothetical protein
MINNITYKIRELDPDIIAPSTKRMYDPEQGGSKLVVIGKPGCLLAGTKVLMFDGNVKNVEDIVVGDKLMGDDSTVRNVLELCRGTDEMYKISPKNSMSYIVNLEHIMTLKYYGSETEELQDDPFFKGHVFDISVKDYLKSSDAFKNKCRWFKTGVEFEEQELCFDPLLAGAWLGDKEYLKGLCSKPFMETVSDQFVKNSRRKRLLFLSGLLYTNGKLNPKTNYYDLVFKEEHICEKIVFLARSLGLDVHCECVNSKFHLSISDDPDIPSFKNEKDRKFNSEILSSKFTITPVGIDNYYGFCLDGNKRHLLGDFSVTHNSGKSTLISSLLYEKSHIFPTGIAMSASEDSNHHYSKSLFPSTFVFNGLDKEKLEEFVKRQEAAKKVLPNPWSIVVLDDCMEDPKIFNDPLFGKIFKNGRHFKMLLVIGLQYALDVRPTVRVCIDGCFILRETNIKTRKAIFENYAGVIGDFSLFCDLMDSLTNDFCALYIHNTSTSNKIEDCVFWYKARPVPKNFKLGCAEYWAFHNERFEPEPKLE